MRMKLYLFIAIFSFVGALTQAAVIHNMTGLHVVGNKLYNANNQVVQLVVCFLYFISNFIFIILYLFVILLYSAQIHNIKIIKNF